MIANLLLWFLTWCPGCSYDQQILIHSKRFIEIERPETVYEVETGKTAVLPYPRRPQCVNLYQVRLRRYSEHGDMILEWLTVTHEDFNKLQRDELYPYWVLEEATNTWAETCSWWGERSVK